MAIKEGSLWKDKHYPQDQCKCGSGYVRVILSIYDEVKYRCIDCGDVDTVLAYIFETCFDEVEEVKDLNLPSSKQKVCDCSISSLMAFGCKCGGK